MTECTVVGFADGSWSGQWGGWGGRGVAGDGRDDRKCVPPSPPRTSRSGMLERRVRASNVDADQ